MPLDRDELAALVSVVNTGSFRAAAEELKRAQSSISYAIKNLEKEFEIEIFNRNTYRPKLTTQGELIYHKAKHVLKMQSELADFASSLKSGLETSISLEINVLFPSELLATALEKFRNKFPQIQILLSIKPKITIETTNAVSKIIIDTENSNACASLEKTLITTIEKLPVSHPEYPAVQKGLTEAYFSNLTELKVHNDSCSQNNVWSVMNYELMKELISRKLAWAYIPTNLIQTELTNNTLVKIPSLNTKHTPLYLYRDKSKALGPAAEYLYELFQL